MGCRTLHIPKVLLHMEFHMYLPQDIVTFIILQREKSVLREYITHAGLHSSGSQLS